MEPAVTERFERIEANLDAMVHAQAGLQNMLSGLVETITRYTDASEVRMKRMEENLHCGAFQETFSRMIEGVVLSAVYFLRASCIAFERITFLLKRSTRPSVSISFCLPVKKGWQLEQISTRISPLWEDRVWKVDPHAQMTLHSL